MSSGLLSVSEFISYCNTCVNLLTRIWRSLYFLGSSMYKQSAAFLVKNCLMRMRSDLIMPKLAVSVLPPRMLHKSIIEFGVVISF